MIHVIAAIEIAAGRRDDFLAEFFKVVPLVLAEQGCLAYGPTIDVETNIPAQGDPRPDVVTVVEQWESLDDLEDHLMAPHMLEYRKRVQPLVQSVQLQVLEPAAPPAV
ncbi:putative quinol monooxygenase [Lignipirellula cremea]|uniref:Putative quinol monooxygenase YgiN n=1 Tax=Lignipirellula cremea TaxID=2528010 RepID=A0A518DY16_9BACT|nr:antibiotic biosynthesis monooxygenase family protein [Lignipirellula cremea]QDU96736.1 putative quinol monooxygenase YgiN [Lignipirellula cremea]